MNKWYEINKPQGVISPALLVYTERIKKNIEMMIEIAVGTAFLRPHIKTHKIAEIIQLQLDYGITKFKCATITEAELLAKYGAIDILLAMQPVRMSVIRFFELIQQYPDAKFSTIVDNSYSINEISELAFTKGIIVSLWLDINNGMNRTGIQPTKEAVKLYKSIVDNQSLLAKGLHVYDGHIHESDFNLRKEICDKDFESVLKLKENLEEIGIKIETIVAGGTPTFPVHITRKGVETSPGTPLLWDQGYTDLYPDLKFLSAAVLITSIISKPATNLFVLI
jgi:D-serine deaminase-like pyridoxal phosphate-dependent protein